MRDGCCESRGRGVEMQIEGFELKTRI